MTQNYNDFLNVETKHEYSEKAAWKIEEKFHPDSSFDFPVTIFEEKSKEGKIKVVKRKPNSDWFIQYDWLHYDISKDRVFCYICKKFSKIFLSKKTESSFVSNGTRDWKGALRKFAKHEGSNYHCEAVRKFFDTRSTENSGDLSKYHSQPNFIGKVENDRETSNVFIKQEIVDYNSCFYLSLINMMMK